MRKTKNNYVPAEYGGYLFPKSCLPDILPGDGGKVLTVNQNETEAIWAQSGGGMVVYVNNPVYDGNVLTGGTLDHTWNQINGALRNGIPVQIVALRDSVSIESSETGLIVLHIVSLSGPVVEDRGYVIDCIDINSHTFFSVAADGYPEYYNS